jgi:hypothetical protein
MDVREGSREHFAREVLRIGGLAHAVEEIPVHGVDVTVVELRERASIAGLGPGDDVRNRASYLKRERGYLGDA